jgi:hypothetical protein
VDCARAERDAAPSLFSRAVSLVFDYCVGFMGAVVSILACTPFKVGPEGPPTNSLLPALQLAWLVLAMIGFALPRSVRLTVIGVVTVVAIAASPYAWNEASDGTYHKSLDTRVSQRVTGRIR